MNNVNYFLRKYCDMSAANGRAFYKTMTRWVSFRKASTHVRKDLSRLMNIINDVLPDVVEVFRYGLVGNFLWNHQDTKATKSFLVFFVPWWLFLFRRSPIFSSFVGE